MGNQYLDKGLSSNILSLIFNLNFAYIKYNMHFGYESQTRETPTHVHENLEFDKNLKMCIVFINIIWIFMQIYGAYSAESLTGNLFRKRI